MLIKTRVNEAHAAPTRDGTLGSRQEGDLGTRNSREEPEAILQSGTRQTGKHKVGFLSQSRETRRARKQHRGQGLGQGRTESHFSRCGFPSGVMKTDQKRKTAMVSQPHELPPRNWQAGLTAPPCGGTNPRGRGQESAFKTTPHEAGVSSECGDCRQPRLYPKRGHCLQTVTLVSAKMFCHNK